jgi:uncharacterized protein YqjF (DUF2071 family)
MARDFLRQTDHRPYPLPAGPWFMAMRWHDLAFLHWPVPAEVLRPLIPEALDIDTREGAAWLGIVPFHMTGVRPWFSPSLPGFSAFPELNVRTYVLAGGRPGVWFLSLDAHQRLAVRAARRTYCLPYFDARQRVTRSGGWIEYASRRTHRAAPPAEFIARYRPVGPAVQSRPGTLAHGALLPVLRRRAGPDLPGRHPPRPLAASAGRGRVGRQHHDRWSGHPPARRAAAGTLRRVPRHGGLVARAGGRGGAHQRARDIARAVPRRLRRTCRAHVRFGSCLAGSD